eukprot:GSMAST32.ASY1.ANO1.101.1 assembled CDS
MTTKAQDIATAVFSGASIHHAEEREDDLEYDLGNLAAFDAHPVDASKVKYLRKLSTKNVQLLIKHIFALESKSGEFAMMAQLPKPETKLPREKHVPANADLTKWQQFAKEKGILNRKRSRMVFDEISQTWRPRYGYKRDAEVKDWLIEVEDHEDIYTDKFAEKKLAKKKRVLKNQMAQLSNLERAEKAKLAANKNTLTASRARGNSAKRGMMSSKAALGKASVSTASLGQFDNILDGEAPRKIGKRRRFLDSNSSTKERDLQLMQLAVSGKTGNRASIKDKRKLKAGGVRKSRKKMKKMKSSKQR